MHVPGTYIRCVYGWQDMEINICCFSVALLSLSSLYLSSPLVFPCFLALLPPPSSSQHSKKVQHHSQLEEDLQVGMNLILWFSHPSQILMSKLFKKLTVATFFFRPFYLFYSQNLLFIAYQYLNLTNMLSESLLVFLNDIF